MPIKSREALEKRKEAILSSAIDVLSKREYHECPVEAIAAKAGIGKGTFYLYFRSKEELYSSITLKIVEELKDIIDSTGESRLSARDKITRVFSRTSEYIVNHDYLITAVHANLKPARGKLHSKLHQYFSGVKGSLEKIIKAGASGGEFKECDSKLFSSVLFSLLMTSAKFKARNRSCSKNNISGAVADFFIKGMGQ